MTFPDWTARTVICVASGPSLTLADCEAVRASGLPTVVTNNTWEKCPWAHAIFAADLIWWTWNMVAVRTGFAGVRVCDHRRNGTLDANGHPSYRGFHNSGASAIALAIACGAAKVVMLGYDCQKTDGRWHHHADHPPGRNCATMSKWPGHFEALAKWAAPVSIINASRVSALTCFPRANLEDVITTDVHLLAA